MTTEVLRGATRWKFFLQASRSFLNQNVRDQTEGKPKIKSPKVLGRGFLSPRGRIGTKLGGNCSQEVPAPVSEGSGGEINQEIKEQLEDLNALDRLEIHGFMTMAPWTPEPEKTRPVFQGLQHLRLRCEDLMGVPFPVMSMGMSNDFEIAIEEGSTIIRIGTSLFGKRSYAASKNSAKP